MKLKDRVALVTGASRGIGRGIALAYAREGARVAVNYNATPEGATDVIRQIRAAGGQAEGFAGDVGDTAQMDALFAAVYLASDEARYVTGTYLLVDGGMLIAPDATI